MDEKILEKTDSFKAMIEFCHDLPEVVEHADSNISLKHRVEMQEEYVDEHFSDSEDVFEVEEEESDSLEDSEDTVSIGKNPAPTVKKAGSIGKTKKTNLTNHQKTIKHG